MPVLMITGQKPIRTSKQRQFQIVDVVDMMHPLTKFTQQIVSGDNIPSRPTCWKVPMMIAFRCIRSDLSPRCAT